MKNLTFPPRTVLIGMLTLVTFIVSVGFLLGKERRLIALNGKTGRIVWSSSLSQKPATFGTPVVSQDGVLIPIVQLMTSPQQDRDTSQPFTWKLYSFERQSGRLLWRFEPKDTPLEQTTLLSYRILATTEDTLYLSRYSQQERQGVVEAIATATGKIQWRYGPILTTHWTVDYPSQQVSGDQLFVIAPEGERLAIHSLDRKTGKRRHTLTTFAVPKNPSPTPTPKAALPEPSAHLSPKLFPLLATQAQQVLVASSAALSALDGETGAETFQRRMDSTVHSLQYSLGVDKDTVYVGYPDQLVALNADTGTRRWVYNNVFQHRVPAPILRQFRLDGDHLYLTCLCSGYLDRSEGWVIALNRKDGKELWASPVSETDTVLFPQAPIVGKNAVFIAGHKRSTTPKDRGAIALDKQTGQEQWHFRFRTQSDTPLASDGDRLFLTDISPRWRNGLAYLNPDWH